MLNLGTPGIKYEIFELVTENGVRYLKTTIDNVAYKFALKLSALNLKDGT